MSLFFRIFTHLLPRARAWRITVDKRLRELFDGLSGLGDDIRVFIDDAYDDLKPSTTRELDAWEEQFALRKNASLTEQQRRDRVDAAWKALGGQDPRYLQDTLQSNGFDVYFHEWWEPGTEPAVGVKSCVTPRSPLTVLRREFTGTSLLIECGEANAACGEVDAECGNGLEPVGYPLVNKIFESIPDYFTLCGEAVAECGEDLATCGNFVEFTDALKEYIVPSDPAKWPYFLYIGGPTFGDVATIENSRRNEFEALCLGICPAQQWLGIIVQYT